MKFVLDRAETRGTQNVHAKSISPAEGNTGDTALGACYRVCVIILEMRVWYRLAPRENAITEHPSPEKHCHVPAVFDRDPANYCLRQGAKD